MIDRVSAQPVEFLWPDGAPGAMGTSPQDCPSITAYLPAGREVTSAVVVCPGGGYQILAPHESEPIARWLCSMGVAGIVLQYRLNPYRHPSALSDAHRAIRMVRARAGQWRIDPGRVGILGFSAGGHLAASAATLTEPAYTADPADPVDELSCRPDAAILCYPVISGGPFAHVGSFEVLLGGATTEQTRRPLSLDHHVTTNTPPMFLWHTADDSGVPVENSLLMAAALSRCEVPFALHVFPHGEHGLGLAENDPVISKWTSLCGDWLAEIGFRSSNT